MDAKKLRVQAGWHYEPNTTVSNQQRRLYPGSIILQADAKKLTKSGAKFTVVNSSRYGDTKQGAVLRT